jgi:hypothetical protein
LGYMRSRKSAPWEDVESEADGNDGHWWTRPIGRIGGGDGGDGDGGGGGGGGMDYVK